MITTAAIAALDVEAALVFAGQDPRCQEVDCDADQRDHQDHRSFDGRRGDEVADALVDDQQPEHEQRYAICLGAQDLGPPKAVGHRPGSRARCQPSSEQRERQRRRIGQHVGGVGEQRQRRSDHGRDDLGNHEDDDQRERRGQRTPVSVAASVRVASVRVAAVRAAAVRVMGVAHRLTESSLKFPGGTSV